MQTTTGEGGVVPAFLGTAIAVLFYFVWGRGDADGDGQSNLAEYVRDADSDRDGIMSGSEVASAAVLPLSVVLVSLFQAKLLLLLASACLFLWHARGAYKRITSLESKPVFPLQALAAGDSMLQFLQMEFTGPTSTIPASGYLKRSRTDIDLLVKDFTTDRRKSLAELSARFVAWDFDIFEVPKHTERPLVYVGFFCLDAQAHEDFDQKKLLSFLHEVEDSYRDVPYHNRLHGSAVARSAFSMCKHLGLQQGLSQPMQFALVLAALVHDVGHPGLTAPFLTRACDELAVRYNDVSPLENMHLAVAFSLMRKEENAFLSSKALSLLKGPMVKAVLGTDLTRHGEQIQRLDALIDNLRHGGSQGSIPWFWPAKPPPACKALEQRREWMRKMQEDFLMEVFLHAADVATPALPFEQFLRWNGMIQEEFHNQGDREIAEFGALISVPDGYDRNAGLLRHHNFTCGFVNFVVSPLFFKLDEISKIKDEDNLASGIDLSPCLDNLRRNAKQLEERAPVE